MFLAGHPSQERSHLGRGSLMVSTRINVMELTKLHIIRKGNLMAQRYADNILRPLVMPYAAIIGGFFLKNAG
ncbi:hypothetical protein TNCV_2348861 [Trichonephila clavipes]|uniref:Uncharacterized protein n=1 Tax=Trichonephila clavipes TaxID=2585209 RepID=A0A8X6SMK2_TRICX|nr:hypothetical protein TNCV_2348861 [Trichonephila clavipes]